MHQLHREFQYPCFSIRSSHSSRFQYSPLARGRAPLFLNPLALGFYLLSGKTSCHQISLSLDAMRSGCRNNCITLNFKSSSTAALSIFLEWVDKSESISRGFEISRAVMERFIYRLVTRGPGPQYCVLGTLLYSYDLTRHQTHAYGSYCCKLSNRQGLVKTITCDQASDIESFTTYDGSSNVWGKSYLTITCAIWITDILMIP